MNAKLLVVSVLVGVMTTACMSVPQDGGGTPPVRTFANKHKIKPPKPCIGGNCSSLVDITDCSPSSPSQYCTINYDVVLLAKGKQPSITFSITDGFEFKEVRFERDDLIRCAAKTTPPRTTDWECTSTNVDYGIYKFTIDVKSVGPIDPWLIND